MQPFQDMTEADGAWMARILARFTRAHVEAAVRAGDLTAHLHRVFLVDTLMARRDRILRRYFAKLSPLTDLSIAGDRLCAVDLARQHQVFPAFRYTASTRRGDGAATPSTTEAGADGTSCVRVPRRILGAGVPHDDASRYVVVSIENGTGSAPLQVHAYDLDDGLRIVGVVR